MSKERSQSSLLTATPIKFAKPEDITQIVALGHKEFEENGLLDLKIDINFDKALNHITNLVLDHVVLVKRNEENPKMIDGAAAFQISPTWFSDAPMLMGIMLYVKPEYRSKKVAKNLLDATKEYAIMNRLPIVFDLFTKKDVEKKRKFFKYLGFEDWGSSFIWQHKEG